ncbi:MAG TPA: DUF2382 domain-containing protein [Waterburya sp.]|jgi:stress response protein YsnF
MPANKTEMIKNKERINELLEKLRKKLKGFLVINRQGQIIGQIEDFLLDPNRRLKMIISESNSLGGYNLFLVSSKHIQTVDTENRQIFVDINKAELEKSPVYRSNDNDNVIELPSVSPTSPATQTGRSSSDELSPSNDRSLTQEDNSKSTEPENTPEVVEEQTVRLLEERLLVNRSQRKIGEIVVRKQIETQILEVPIQSEKLVIDKVGPQSEEPVEVERLSVEQISNARVTPHSELSPTSSTTQLSSSQPLTKPTFQERDNPNFPKSDDISEVVEEEIIRLLEERLVVNRSKWKVGEVVVRKEIENQIVQVPIRREKLIIEQVSPETKIIAEIDLGKGDITSIQQAGVPSTDTANTVSGEFLSPKTASNLLDAIAYQKHHGCAKVRVELVVDDPELQEMYQNMFNRCTISS